MLSRIWHSIKLEKTTLILNFASYLPLRKPDGDYDDVLYWSGAKSLPIIQVACRLSQPHFGLLICSPPPFFVSLTLLENVAPPPNPPSVCGVLITSY